MRMLKFELVKRTTDGGVLRGGHEQLRFQHVSTSAQACRNAVAHCFELEIIRFARTLSFPVFRSCKEYPAIEQEHHAFCDVV